MQRHVLYLGEINSSQAEVWRKAIEVFDADAGSSRTLALFPEDRCEVAVKDASAVRLRISEMRLHCPRQWGACWLAGPSWRELQLHRFWPTPAASRKRTRWDQVLEVPVAYRLIDPQRVAVHRQWFGDSAMADLLGRISAWPRRTSSMPATACCSPTRTICSASVGAMARLFIAIDVLLYDLTSTYFEGNATDLPEGAERRHGYSRDKRPDCPQLVIALVVTPEGLPLAYEVLPGNTPDTRPCGRS